MSEIFFKDKVIGLADIIDNQFIIHLAKPSILKFDVMKNPISKIWHVWLGYLSYKTIEKLVPIALGIEFNSLILLKICKGCMVGQQQH